MTLGKPDIVVRDVTAGDAAALAHVIVTATDKMHRWFPRGPLPLPPLGGEGGGEGQGACGIERRLKCEKRSPLSPALSPAYLGEGVEALCARTS